MVMGSRAKVGLAVLLIGLFFGALSWALYVVETGPDRYARRDFMSLWGGGRALWEGVNPYDPDVWLPLRARYGSDWMPDARAPFPLWTFLISAPFALLDVGWGAAAWLSFSLLLLIGGTALLLRRRAEPLPAAAFFLFMLGMVGYRPGLVTLNNGQITFVLVCIFLLFIYFETEQRPFLAGLALSLIIIKPNPFVAFVPLMALWLLWRRRWWIVAGAAAGGLGLLALTWLLQPGWLFEWLAVREKAEVVFITPTVWGLAHDVWPAGWAVLGLLLAAGITAVCGWLFLTRPRLSATDAASLALTASLLTTPYAWIYEQHLLLIPLIVLFLRLQPGRAAWLMWIGLVLLLPWLMYWIDAQRQVTTLSALMPLLVGLAYYWLAVKREAPELALETNSVSHR